LLPLLWEKKDLYFSCFCCCGSNQGKKKTLVNNNEFSLGGKFIFLRQSLYSFTGKLFGILTGNTFFPVFDSISLRYFGIVRPALQFSRLSSRFLGFFSFEISVVVASASYSTPVPDSTMYHEGFPF